MLLRLVRRLSVSAILVIALRTTAFSAQIQIPLEIPWITINEALKHALYSSAGNRAELWNGSDSCQYLYAENPVFAQDASNVRFDTDSTLMLGIEMGDNCVSPLQWTGIIQARTRPYVTPDWKLRFKVDDLELLDSSHQRTAIASRVFDVVKSYFIPKFEEFAYDLRPPMKELSGLIEMAAPADRVALFRESLATMRVLSPIRGAAEGLKLTITMTIP